MSEVSADERQKCKSGVALNNVFRIIHESEKVLRVEQIVLIRNHVFVVFSAD